jgi:hypothetical protein
MAENENSLTVNEWGSFRKIFTPGIVDGTIKIKPLKNGNVRVTHPMEVSGKIKKVTRVYTDEEAVFIIGLKNELGG